MSLPTVFSVRRPRPTASYLYVAIVVLLDEGADEEHRLVQMLLQRQVDGLLVVPAGSGSEAIELCRERGVHLVVVDRRPQGGDADIVRGEVVEIHVDHDARHISAPAEGVSALTRIAARLGAAGIELDDIGLQRPSLDDVFLSLTGHRAEPAADATGEGSPTTVTTEATR